MLNGLDLFTGIGGITLGLKEWVRPIAYCEIDPYCQSLLLSRMQEGDLPKAPIWDDIRTLSVQRLHRDIDIISGGFPCQDISVAGTGKGLEGERSGLFYEIARLTSELRPRFVFLENVPAITVRGGNDVVGAFAKMGYDCRWCVISAASVGAMHKRERWFLLANSNRPGCRKPSGPFSVKEKQLPIECSSKVDGNTNSVTKQQADKKSKSKQAERRAWGRLTGQYWPFESRDDWQETVSSMGKCSNGLPNQLDRLKALGNAVVPIQVKEAFKLLMGINNAATS